MSKSLATILFLFTFHNSGSARILCVFPFPSLSHQAVYRTLTEELLNRGHELVIITTHPSYPKNGSPQNLVEIDVHDVSQKGKADFASIFKLRVKDPDASASGLAEVMHDLFMAQFETEEFQKIIKEEFDLILLEALVTPSIILSHFIKAPVILISSFGSAFNYKAMGVPAHEFLYPSQFRREHKTKTSVWKQSYDIYFVNNFENQMVKENIQDEEFKTVIGHDTPSMKELWNNVDMLILNQFNMWEGVRPTPQSVIHTGGMLATQNGTKELSQDLKNFLDSSVNGVIYVSFGTLIPYSGLSMEKIQIMTKVFSDLPYDVMWRQDRDDLPRMGLNIKTFKWVPQTEVLKHPNLKLFITHGGLHSTDEAIDAGVPVIGIPFISDQFFNSNNFERFNIGLRLNFISLTEESLKTAIVEVITDERYRSNVVELRNLLQDQPFTSLAKQVYWIEYVLRHGGAQHLRAPAANMHWTQYFEIGLLFIVLLVSLIVIFAVAMLLYCFYRLSTRFFKFTLK